MCFDRFVIAFRLSISVSKNHPSSFRVNTETQCENRNSRLMSYAYLGF